MKRKKKLIPAYLFELDNIDDLYNLIRRAAELLRDEPYNRGDQREWRRKRSEWLRDAGMEK
jgi:hypothetical protein